MPLARSDRVATLAALAFIAVICLPPAGPSAAGEVDLCLLCGPNGGASAFLNVVLYLPLGAALHRRTRSLWRPVLLGALTSLAVELLQLVIPGRHTALSDLAANTLGAGVGAGLALQPRAWLLPRGIAGRIAAALSVAVAGALFVLAGLLFQPSAPPGDYYAQWHPGAGYGRAYDGTVLAATLGDLPLPSERLRDAEGVRARIRARAPLQVRFVAGTPMRPLTPVFRLVAGPFDSSDEVAQVGIDGPHLVLTPRLRADDWRTARPEVQLEGALAGVDPGDTVTVTLQARPDHGWEVRVGDGPPTLVGLTAARSWSLFYATTWRREAALAWMDVTWMAALGLVIGWFAPGARARGVGILVALAAAVTTPLWSHLSGVAPLALAALALGAAAGGLVRDWLGERYRRDGAHSS